MKSRIRSLLYYWIFTCQKSLLFLSYWIFYFGKKDKISWVVGVYEIANNVNFIAKSIEHSYSVSFSPHKFYPQNTYNFLLPKLPGFSSTLIKLIIGPILLGYLSHRATGFFYIANNGFLLERTDGRDYEFAFLKKKKKKLINLFCGSDVRSSRLSLEYAAKLQIDVMATYDGLDSDAHEAYLKKFAKSADKYLDSIISLPVDQISYIKRKVTPFFYAYPDARFIKNEQKFQKLEPIVIVHAPSFPIIKGTPLIRAAIKKLRVEGYVFEYIELVGVTNDVVISALRRAHIVVCQLYAFVPGLFGIEAMAANCALLTSADRNIEYILPEGANEAWFVTKYWEIYEHLKHLLDNPSLIKEYADRGYDWCYKHYRASMVENYLREIVESIDGDVKLSAASTAQFIGSNKRKKTVLEGNQGNND